MSDSPTYLDLSLWRDKEIIIRQNKLRASFWEIFSEIGNTTLSKNICQHHKGHKGVKLAKGNDLLGFPYQVLDLIRDFNPNRGMNIRILNWFGHGMYFFILFGKNHPLSTKDFFLQSGFYYTLSPTPWDYPEIILGANYNVNPNIETFEKSDHHQWYKEIKLGNSSDIQTKIEMELKIISDFLNQ